MSWWQLVPTVLWTLAIVFVPGYVVVRCWALTGMVAAGTAAPVSIGLIAGAAVLGPMAGLSWSVLLVVVPSVVLAGAGLLLRTFAPRVLGVRDRRPRRPLRARWTLLAYAGAVLIPAVLLVRGLALMIINPENISQTYDNVFHLNAIRYILETGSGSSLTLGGMSSDGADPSLYPGAWHDLVSLVVQVSGVSIPVAVNAVTLVVGAFVWPVSGIFLVTRVTGTRPAPALFAGASSAVFGAFPYLMVDFGVLYPFFLSVALLPAALALVAIVTGVGAHEGTPRGLAALALLTTVAGLALAHPSTMLALSLFAMPLFVVALVRYRRGRTPGRAGNARFAGLVVLLTGYLAGWVVLWSRLRPSETASFWGPIQTVPQAIGQVLSAGFIKEGPSWIALLLTLVAVGLVLRGRFNWWVLGGYLIAAALFVMVSGVPHNALRNFLTGVWYNDTRRLAGQLPVVIVVVCAITATWLFVRTLDRVTDRYATRFPALSALRPTTPGAPDPVRAAHAAPMTPAGMAVAFVAAVVVGVVGQYSAVNYAIWDGRASYEVDAQAPVLSAPERTLLNRLDETVPPDATIIGNPWTGTALAYALGERRTLTPHVGGTVPPRVQTLMDNLHNIGTDPLVCSTIRELNSYYVLHFTGPQVHGNDITFTGLVAPSLNPALTRVDQEGTTATLYRITGC